MVPAEAASWTRVCEILRNHIKAGHNCEKTVNRLWTKGVSESRPYIYEKHTRIYIERWRLGRLWGLVRDGGITDETPHAAGDPPIVVRWRGADYRIDGRRRINHLKRIASEGPHAVLIVDIDGSEQDV